MDKDPEGSSIGLSVISSIIILLNLSVLVAELILKPVIQQFLPEKRLRMHRGFIPSFATIAMLFSMLELSTQVMSIVGSKRGYSTDEHRVYFAIQRAIEGLMSTGLIALSVLLLYHTSLTAMRAKLYMFGPRVNEQVLTQWIGIKGVMIVSTLLFSAVILGVNSAESIVIALKEHILDAVIAIRVVLAFVLYVPILLILSASITCAYNVLVAKSSAFVREARDGINTYGDEMEEQVTVGEDDDTILARQQGFAYMIISCLLLLRIGLSMFHELMFVLNYSGVLRDDIVVTVSDWLDSVVHAACIGFFVVCYFRPITRYIPSKQSEPLSLSTQPEGKLYQQ